MEAEMRKSAHDNPERKLTSLIVPRAEAKDMIRGQIDKLNTFVKNPPSHVHNLHEMKDWLDQWAKYNIELLKRLFDNDLIVHQYESAQCKGFNIRHSEPLWTEENPQSEADKFISEVQIHVTELKGILERLELIPEAHGVTGVNETNDAASELGTDVFVVHGHDEAAKQELARFIEKLGLKSVILHEQPNAGRTIIEKFEDYSNVGFAVVLMTPDDVGASKDKKDQAQPRARQNVVFELGFFIGKLGRNRVCALYKEEVEIPSDYIGVLYVPMDGNGGWQLKLAKEIKAAGISIDLNKAIN